MKKISKKRKQAGSTNNMLLPVIGVLLLVAGAYVGFSQITKLQTVEEIKKQLMTKAPENTSPHTVVYGVWAGNGSLVKAYNLEDKKNYVLAELPQNIKRVTSVMPDTLYFINNTDENDHGTELVKYSIGSKQQTLLVRAEAGFGMDDYFISPNGKYLTTWEVQVPQGRRVLTGGKSRVYTVDLNDSSNKNLIYNEDADKPVHYPRGITNDGVVITDMFLPNTGPGWGYGMGSSDFTGTQKKDSTSMTNGTYGRQPRISDDGTQLAFVGYDGTNGSGTEQVEGIRRAIIHPNTVEILSPETLQRTKLPNLSNTSVFDDVRFDKSGQYLFINQIRLANNQFKTYVRLYKLADNSSVTIPNTANKRGIAVLSDSQVLVSTPIVTVQTMGNLGETYQFLNSNFEIINPANGQAIQLPISDTNLQYIGIYPNSAVPAFSEADGAASKDSIQLYTFALKPELMSDRRRLQSGRVTDANGISNVNIKGLRTLAQNINEVPNNGSQAAAPTNVQPSGNPSISGISGIPSIPGISGIPIEGNEEIIKEIERLIELIRQLLGILEQETQN